MVEPFPQKNAVRQSLLVAHDDLARAEVRRIFGEPVGPRVRIVEIVAEQFEYARVDGNAPIDTIERNRHVARNLIEIVPVRHSRIFQAVLGPAETE